MNQKLFFQAWNKNGYEFEVPNVADIVDVSS
jgi:hypothetical protein